MASIIEKYASEDVTLLQGQIISDGKPSFSESIAAKAPSSHYAIPMHEGFYQLGENSREKQRKVNVMVGRKFITRAIDENRPTIKEIIKNDLKI